MLLCAELPPSLGLSFPTCHVPACVAKKRVPGRGPDASGTSDGTTLMQGAW